MLDEPVLLLRAADAARLCGVSTVTWRRWDSAGRIPQGLKVGGARLWRRVELQAWVEAGMPNRQTWVSVHLGKSRGARK